MAPVPVKAEGKWWLVYELHITNFHTNNVELAGVEVFSDSTKELMARHANEDLASALSPATSIRRKKPSEPPDNRVIGRAMQVVMYLLIAVEQAKDVPITLHHRLLFRSAPSAGNSEEVVEIAPVTVHRKQPLVLGPPLRGER